MLVPFTALLLPAVVAAVAIFIVSSLIHMFSPWHKSDFAELPNEAAVLAAMRPFNIPPDDYLAPKMHSLDDMKSAEFKAKRDAGPVFIMTVFPNGSSFSMASNMINWFVYILVITLIAGVLTATTVAPGGDGRVVFHYSAVTTFLAFAGALFQASIWYHKKWSTSLKSAFDGAIYAAIVGGAFVLMWPKA